MKYVGLEARDLSLEGAEPLEGSSLTIKDLIEKLKTFPEDMEVMMWVGDWTTSIGDVCEGDTDLEEVEDDEEVDWSETEEDADEETDGDTEPTAEDFDEI